MGISFHAAERNYELRNQPPEVPMGYLDTDAGRRWLRDAAERVVEGQDVVWKRWMNDQRGLTVDMLYIELTQRCGQGPCTSEDVMHAWNSRDETLDALRTDWKSWAISVAMELLAPLADDYAEYLKEEAGQCE